GKNIGGLIEEKYDTRQYPYGALARRTIGYVKDNSKSNGNNMIGLEGKYNYILHGNEGSEWKRITVGKKWIPDFDSTIVKAKNGMDLLTTIDINMQDIADKIFRKNLADESDIEGGCVIILDVKTGAIRTMVNLRKNKDGGYNESYNYAIGRAGDPGSVFKLTTLMTLLEDGKVSLQDMVPTFGGEWVHKGVRFKDSYLKNKGDKISVKDGLKISSNHVFRYLACQNYDNDPERFIEKLYEYKLNEQFDFDLMGLAAPKIPKPSDKNWN
ncbi:penicillin-binding protein 2, partial [gut metagenome]